jgi:selenocysteine lyase/cysteine desulfurase
MPGTASHEGIVGTMAAIDYLAQLGDGRSRREKLRSAFERIGDHERDLTVRLLDGLSGLPRIRVRGITDRSRLDERVPTISFTHADRSPAEIARRLGGRGIFVWHGNFYAIAATTSLGLEPDGLVRIGILHYNTAEEIDRLLAELAQL